MMMDNNEREKLSPNMQNQFALQKRHAEKLERIRKARTRTNPTPNTDAEPEAEGEETN
jgi:hypothetical protein